MELRQAHYVVAVAEELHFGRAAARLHIGQPAVSQQIRRLEREFGLDLFDRTTRTVTLTPAGRAFLPRARALIRAERAALDAMSTLRGEDETTLRVGTNIGLGSRLDELLTVLGEQAPDLSVELHGAPAAQRLRRVREGAWDAAFIRGADHSPDLELLPLWSDDLVAALPACHALAGGDEIDLADLAGLPLRITARQDNPHLYDTVVEACRSAGFEPMLGPAFTCDQDALAAIGSGRPNWTVFYAAQAAVEPGSRIAFRRFAAPAPSVLTCLAVRPDPPSRRLAALLDACRRVAASEERPADPS
ncbi:LysR substrate-binding domain-containing protein [Streptomyces sp. NPDC048416]|uniref:LysR substrate-binding domain-containing protein n=1 Tax=Streptomyces sp. NPDC048416 TaxID=3365546 RepID=UPI0037237477